MALKANVQQQNAALRAEILAAARRGLRGEPRWLSPLLSISGLDAAKGIVAKLETVPEQGGTYVSGIWVTPEHEFFRFEAFEGENSAPDPEPLEDITSSVVVSNHLPGTGKSFGALAIEVLNEVRAS